MLSKKWLVSTLAVATLACPATAAARTPDDVPPPPSLMAASAAKEYEQLRAPDEATLSQDLRSPDTRDAANGYAPPAAVEDIATDDGSPTGFDVVSGGIGAAVGIGLAIAAVLLSGAAGGRHPRRHVART
jgi:hypothetical protein